MPETISTTNIYKGKIFDLRTDRICEDGNEYDREIVVHPGSAVIVPYFDDGTVALVRQYRHAAGDYLLELPAGSLDPGEDPKTGAIRELEEEIGVTASSVELLTEFYVSPGFLTEKMFVYLATGMTETSQNLDEDENIEIVRLQLSKACKLAGTGEIQDAKTIAGLLLTAKKLGIDF